MPLTGQKHLIRCWCVLPQFKSLRDPPQHQFPVFSIIEENGDLRTKWVKCNNCDVVHRVYDICKSEILTDVRDAVVTTIDDVKSTVSNSSSNIASVLETHDADLATWETVRFIIENQKWGDFVVLASDVAGNERHGKYIRILSESLFKIDTFVREEYVIRD